jgi:predicted TPR repeat methyltransferase
MAERITDNLWKPHTVEETLQLYAEWAESYDADIESWGYATPERICAALADRLDDRETPILDFGCGTGYSGRALKSFGFTTLDGTDVSSDMIAVARTRGIYRRLWVSEPGDPGASPGDYRVITAMGVISKGAAPADMLRPVLTALAPGGLLALSYNDATLQDPAYTDAMAAVLREGLARTIFEEYGDHLPGKDMKSTVYILEKT